MENGITEQEFNPRVISTTEKFAKADVLSEVEPYAFQVESKKSTELPSTGGIGTTIFYVVGAILVIGAGVVLITRRRMDG